LVYVFVGLPPLIWVDCALSRPKSSAFSVGYRATSSWYCRHKLQTRASGGKEAWKTNAIALFGE